MILKIKNKILSIRAPDRAIRTVAYVAILFTCIVIFFLSYNFLLWYNAASEDPKTFVIESRIKYERIKEEYNQMRADIVIANNLYSINPSLESDSQPLIDSINNKIYVFKHDTSNTLSYLYDKNTFESNFKKELILYLEEVYNTPLVSKQNYLIYIYYIKYKQVNSKLIQKLNNNTQNLNSPDDLIYAQQTISEYVNELQNIQKEIEQLNVSIKFENYKNKVNESILLLINYNLEINGYYNSLSVALNKDLESEVAKYIELIKNSNSSYSISATKINNEIKELWKGILEEDDIFNLKSLENRNKIDLTYEELIKKYQIE